MRRGGRVGGRGEAGHVGADEILGGAIEELEGRPVGIDVIALGVHEQDGVDGPLEQGPEALLTIAQGLLGVILGATIPYVNEQDLFVLGQISGDLIGRDLAGKEFAAAVATPHPPDAHGVRSAAWSVAASAPSSGCSRSVAASPLRVAGE